MYDPVIRVEHISKRYELGRRALFGRSFREMLVDTAKAPFRRLFSGQKTDASSFWALDDISFEVQRGEIVGLIGRNGAGKSTMLKILSRITEPTSGRAQLRGRVASLLEVGTGFHPELTGRENIFLNGALLGMTRAEIKRKFDAIVEFAEIEKFLDTAVKHYSSGMYVRLAFAVAAHLEAEILLVDEVLAVGDMAFQRKCLGKMRDLVGDTSRTVLFVSHNMAAIEALCERALYFERGKLTASGPARQIILKYFSGIGEHAFHRDLDSVHRTEDLGKELRFLSIEIVGRDGDDLQSIGLAQPFNIRFRYQVSKPLTGMLVYVRIETMWGEVIIDSWDRDSLCEEEMRPGVYAVSVEVTPQDLHPGQYQITLGAGVLNHRWSDRLDGILTFAVEPFSESGTFVAPERSAVLFRKLQWDRRLESSPVATPTVQARRIGVSR